MIDKVVSYGGVDWIYEFDPSKKFINEIIENYELHEIVEEDISESNNHDKIDVYDQCLFVVLHFPKYNTGLSRYISNEFDILIGKNYLITITDYQTENVLKLKEDLIRDLKETKKDEKHKFSPYYLLYRIMDAMYDKTIRALDSFVKDLRVMENNIFKVHGTNKAMLESLMIRKRNVVMLKHMFLPQQEIIGLLQQEMLKFFGGELDVYFEDLAYKVDKILNQVDIIREDIESLYDSYNAMVNMRTNTIITILTLFTAITGILTFVSGIFGMNVPIPGAHNPATFSYLLGSMSVTVLLMIIFFKTKKRL